MASNHSSTDRIEKQIRLHAPQARAWRALTDVDEFGQWFGVKKSGFIAPGATLRGPSTIKGYEQLTFEAMVESVEMQTHFRFDGLHMPSSPAWTTQKNPPLRWYSRWLR